MWFIVPRHPQRFDDVARLAQATGWRVSRRSEWGNNAPSETADATLWLGNTLGEMPACYAAARVALLGASFAPLASRQQASNGSSCRATRNGLTTWRGWRKPSAGA